VDFHKNELVQALRDHGENDKANQAEQQLPDHVDKDQHQDLLDRLGIDDNLLGKLPGGIGDKLKGIL
jgi:hypothetical protein